MATTWALGEGRPLKVSILAGQSREEEENIGSGKEMDSYSLPLRTPPEEIAEPFTVMALGDYDGESSRLAERNGLLFHPR